MQNPMERDVSIAADRDDSFRSVVSDLVSLIGHVQASIKLIEGAIVQEISPADQNKCRQCGGP